MGVYSIIFGFLFIIDVKYSNVLSLFFFFKNSTLGNPKFKQLAFFNLKFFIKLFFIKVDVKLI